MTFIANCGKNTTFILKRLKDYKVRLHFLFLPYVFKLINDVNIEVQNQDVRQLGKKFFNKNSIDLKTKHLPINEIYCGAAVDTFIISK